MTTHLILIAVHAAAGAVAFVAGCFAIRRSALFPLYFGALTVSVGSLVVAVLEEWARIDTVSRIVFSGLTVLAFVMLARADRARRLDAHRIGRGNVGRAPVLDSSSRLGRGVPHPQSSTDAAVARYHHMAFTLISLFAAYVVIQVRGLDAPLWAVLGSVAASSLAGHFVSRWFESRAIRLLTRSASAAPG